MPVRRERIGRTFVITLDRPEAMNSIDTEMFLQLGDAWSEFEADEDLWVAVITGAGDRAFCAGRDLVKSAADEGEDWSRERGRTRLTPEGIWKPIIAAVNGHCLAAGLAIALACDLRVAAEHATFGTIAARRGIVAGGGQTQRLARYVPFGKAIELLLFGDRVDAAEAYRIGLVNAVVPRGEALQTALEWAERLVKNAPLAIRAMKRAAYEGGLELPLREGLRLEAKLYSEVLATEDAREGQRAFAEKREPQFRGR